jgi:hypothetical protein
MLLLFNVITTDSRRRRKGGGPNQPDGQCARLHTGTLGPRTLFSSAQLENPAHDMLLSVLNG